MSLVSVGVTVQLTVSPLLKSAPVKVLLVALMTLPPTAQAKSKLTVSPSASVAVPGGTGKRRGLEGGGGCEVNAGQYGRSVVNSDCIGRNRDAIDGAVVRRDDAGDPVALVKVAARQGVAGGARHRCSANPPRERGGDRVAVRITGGAGDAGQRGRFVGGGWPKGDAGQDRCRVADGDCVGVDSRAVVIPIVGGDRAIYGVAFGKEGAGQGGGGSADGATGNGPPVAEADGVSIYIRGDAGGTRQGVCDGGGWWTEGDAVQDGCRVVDGDRARGDGCPVDGAIVGGDGTGHGVVLVEIGTRQGAAGGTDGAAAHGPAEGIGNSVAVVIGGGTGGTGQRCGLGGHGRQQRNRSQDRIGVVDDDRI